MFIRELVFALLPEKLNRNSEASVSYKLSVKSDDDSAQFGLVVSKRLQKLRVPDDGMLSIEVAIDADSRYQASIDSVKLQLYDKLLDGDVSDIKNVGPRWGGAITAAKFLEHFVGDTPWVHLDIAGPSFATSGQAHIDGGGTGCMVRTLIELIGNLASKA